MHEGDDAGVHRHLRVEAELRQGVLRAPEMLLAGERVGRVVEHQQAADEPGGPAAQQRPRVKPARQQPEGDRRQRLEDEDAADELQVDRELRLEDQDHGYGAGLDDERRDLADTRLLGWVGAAVHVLAPDVAREQVRCRDRHDRRGHERADRDRREGDARKPVGEHLVEQQRHDRVVVGLAVAAGQRCHAGLDRHVSQQGEQREHQRVRRQRCHVALDRVAAARGEQRRDRMRNRNSAAAEPNASVE